jgi:hypothetical protein
MIRESWCNVTNYQQVYDCMIKGSGVLLLLDLQGVATECKTLSSRIAESKIAVANWLMESKTKAQKISDQNCHLA